MKKKAVRVLAPKRIPTSEQNLLKASQRILSQRLVEVQEDERRAIARELHDRVGQTLAALNINLIIISGQLGGKVDEQISTRLNDSMKLVAETISLVRDVMSNLRPSVLDDLRDGHHVGMMERRAGSRGHASRALGRLLGDELQHDLARGHRVRGDEARGHAGRRQHAVDLEAAHDRTHVGPRPEQGSTDARACAFDRVVRPSRSHMTKDAVTSVSIAADDERALRSSATG